MGRATKTTKSKEQADRVADEQFESDMNDQDTKTWVDRPFAPFVFKSYRTAKFEDLVLDWEDENLPRLNSLLNLEIMQLLDWAKTNHTKTDTRIARVAHVQQQMIEHLNIFLLQLGENLSTAFTPITIQRSSKEELANITTSGIEGGSSGGKSKVDVSKYSKTNK